MKMNRNNNFITKNYGRLKFEHGLDIVLIDNDEDLIEMLLDKLKGLSEVEDLKENVKWLQGELNDLKIAYQDLEEEFDTFKEEHT
jgi:FtsZ-binding cell division protein ZapB